MERLKRIASVFIIVLLASNSFSVLYAYNYVDDEIFMHTGMVQWKTEGKKKSSNIYYKTIGWNVHKQYVGSGKISSVDHGYFFMKQVDEYDSKIQGNVITEFECSVENVKKGLNSAKNLTWENGETVYLSARMEVRRTNSNGSYTVLGTYDDLATLKASQAWSSPEDFNQYFNKPLTLDLLPEEVHRIIKVNGDIVEDNVVLEDVPGTPFNIKFDKTYSHIGKKAQLKKTYFEKRLERGSQLFVLNATDPNVINRNGNIVVGGFNVIAEYEYNPTLTVQHMDLDTNTMLETHSEEIERGTTVSRSKNSFSGKQYVYNEVSYDGGVTWKERSNSSTRTLKVNQDTIIRFNYSSNSDLLAMLNLTANPDKIEKDKTAIVSFLLDASSSKSKNGIKKYEFWFSATKDFKINPDYTITSSTKTVVQPKVAPNTIWYGKVRVTDSKGNTSEAIAEVTIGEYIPNPSAIADAKLQLNIVRDTPKIVKFEEDYWEGLGLYDYYLDVFVPEDWKDEDGRYEDIDLNFTLDASESTSTNGIGNYKFTDYSVHDNVHYVGTSSVTNPFNVKLNVSPQDVKDGIYSNEYGKDFNMAFRVEVTDSKDSSATDSSYVMLYYRYIFEKEAPDVKLSINKKDFFTGEDALFNASYIENSNTYDIKEKRWMIESENGVVDQGKGTIPEVYALNLAEGTYKARQYITYDDEEKRENEKYAEVIFYVYKIAPPTVKISCDKEKYTIPTIGYFTVECSSNGFIYPIQSKSWRLLTETGQIVEKGEGEFPETYNFSINMDSGNYIAEQTIYWVQDDVLKSASDTCKFILISPKPTADFRVDMKMTNTPTWNRIDVPGETGKQYKQIRIDLTPSIALNESLENPHKTDFTSPNTQIQILPLTDDLQADRSKNNTIHTPNGNDKQLIDNTITFNSKQFIDVRFDSPGKYRIKTRVANQYYTSNWVVRDIIIREDLPPLIDLEVIGKFEEEGIRKVYRDINSLAANFDVIATPKSQDEDTINYSSAKLEIRYDYNYDNDTSNDDVHSKMYITQSVDNLQPYITGTKSYDMSKFNFNMNSSTFAMLGKVRFEYSVSEIPTIPNFNGGTMPAAPVLSGNSYNVPINKKVLVIENRAGTITVEMGKEGKVEIYLIETTQEFPSDIVQGVIREYREKGKVYIIHMDGSKELIN